MEGACAIMEIVMEDKILQNITIEEKAINLFVSPSIVTFPK